MNQTQAVRLSMALCLVALAALPGRVQAQSPAFSFTGGVSFVPSTVSTFGYTFTVGAHPISVTQLGFWDHNLDGLGEAHPITLWDATGITVPGGSTTVPSGTAGILIGSYRYESLGAPLTLAAGGSYTLGATWPGPVTDPTAIIVNSGNITAASGIAYGGARSAFGAMTFSSTDSIGAGNYMSPNFRFTVLSGAGVAPEPGTLALLILGSMIGVSVRRRGGSIQCGSRLRA
jgi:PEP-CTERM motif